MSSEAIDFDKDVVQASNTTPIVVDFWAPWCGPCRVLGPLLEKLAAEAAGRWRLVKVNTDARPDLAQAFRIQGIPAVKLFRNGRVAGELTGALPEPQLRAWFEQHIPSPARAAYQAAAAARADGDTARAKQLVTAALKAEPDNIEARVLQAELTLADDPAGAAASVETIPDTHPAYDRVEAVLTLAALPTRLEQLTQSAPDTGAWHSYLDGIRAFDQHDYEGALKDWIDAVRRNRGIDDEGPRRACVSMFRWLGDGHPLTQSYRSELAQAMF